MDITENQLANTKCEQLKTAPVETNIMKVLNLLEST